MIELKSNLFRKIARETERKIETEGRIERNRKKDYIE